MAKNFDWDFGHGLIIINRSKLQKKALGNASQPLAQWTSKYSSVTFNQVSRELPQGGMNERGLAIEVLWLDSAQYPAISGAPSVNELQWIQYQLDNFASVEEVLDNLNGISIKAGYAKIHYLACDRTGQCATIEPIAGNLVAHSGQALPINALTNNTYEESLKFAKDYVGPGCETKSPSGSTSLARFARVACLAQADANGAGDSDKIFGILANVSQGDFTKWSIVYDLVNATLSWRTLQQSQVKTIDLKKVFGTCSASTTVIDVNYGGSGDVTSKLQPYSTEANRTLVQISLGETMAHLPTSVLEAISKYPESAVCKE